MECRKRRVWLVVSCRRKHVPHILYLLSPSLCHGGYKLRSRARNFIWDFGGILIGGACHFLCGFFVQGCHVVVSSIFGPRSIFIAWIPRLMVLEILTLKPEHLGSPVPALIMMPQSQSLLLATSPKPQMGRLRRLLCYLSEQYHRAEHRISG